MMGDDPNEAQPASHRVAPADHGHLQMKSKHHHRSISAREFAAQHSMYVHAKRQTLLLLSLRP